MLADLWFLSLCFLALPLAGCALEAARPAASAVVGLAADVVTKFRVRRSIPTPEAAPGAAK